MKNVYYHVVTEKPMKIGQEIIFDNLHCFEPLWLHKVLFDIVVNNIF